MQRIYADGEERLAEAIAWAKPRKRMNHRCPTRVITLINKIRRDEDGEEQGIVRLFVASQAIADKTAAVANHGRPELAAGAEAIKRLALEHLMSARRLGFEDFFEPLYGVERIRTSFLQGTGAGIGLFTREILPLVAALRGRSICRRRSRSTSPLLERKALVAAGEKQVEILSKIKTACDGLLALVNAYEKPTACESACKIDPIME